jgi:hypothetical protein
MKLSSMIDDMRNWSFDHWTALSNYNTLSIGYAMASLEHGHLPESGLDRGTVEKVINEIQARYCKGSIYHNWAHAFSTFHVLFCLMHGSALSEVLSPRDVLALQLAALGHDVEHPGHNNQFLVNRRDKLAIVYNDVSVLENHHASVTVSIVGELLDSALASTALRFRKVIVTAILGTDMAKHGEAVAWLEGNGLNVKAVREGTLDLDPDVALSFCSVVLHCVDLAHPTMPWEMHKRLSLLIAEEFYSQHQEEVRLGLPAMPFMGKDPADLQSLAPTQVGFIRFVALPVWEALMQTTEPENDADDAMLPEALQRTRINQDSWQCIAEGRDPGEVPQAAATAGTEGDEKPSWSLRKSGVATDGKGERLLLSTTSLQNPDSQ